MGDGLRVKIEKFNTTAAKLTQTIYGKSSKAAVFESG